jgi:aryl-phospho-beta-D-glucosidase BglC (GH1 family)
MRLHWFDRLRMVSLLLLGAAVFVLAASPAFAQTRVTKSISLKRGLNFGNTFDAPQEGDWEENFKEIYLDRLKQAGFDHVRIPVRWQTHLVANDPTKIDPAWLARIKYVVDQALQRDLRVIINVHHFRAFNTGNWWDPIAAGSTVGRHQQFIGFWEQISNTFKDTDNRLVFELLNEPEGRWSTYRGRNLPPTVEVVLDDTWPYGEYDPTLPAGSTYSGAEALNDVYSWTLSTIRSTGGNNSSRLVIMGGVIWNGVDGLQAADGTPYLKLPPGDTNIALSVHDYSPFEFCVGPSASNPNLKFTTTTRDVIRDKLDKTVAWANANGVAVILTEFGVVSSTYRKRDYAAINEADWDQQRALYMEAVRAECATRNISWTMWDMYGSHSIYNDATDQFIPLFLNALIPPASQRVNVTSNTTNLRLTYTASQAWSPVTQNSATTSNNQRWELLTVSGNRVRIKHVATGLYLNAQSNADNAGVNAAPLDNSWQSMQWFKEDAGNGTFRLKNQWSGRYLNANGTTSGSAVTLVPFNASRQSLIWK